MHGTLQGTAGLAIIMIEGGNDLTTGTTGLAGFGVQIIATVIAVGILVVLIIRRIKNRSKEDFEKRNN